MYQEWYVTEFFSQYAPFKDWVTGEMVKSINFYDAWMLIVNLNPTREAKITTFFYYEDEAPKEFTFLLGAGTQGRLHLQDDSDNLGTANLPPGCNPFKRFGMKVLSSEPVIVQATAGDRIGAERVTNSMATYLFHPGPLGEAEKQWIYVDCLFLVSDKFILEEREWLTILNPNQKPAHCKITFIPGGDVDVKGGITRPARPNLQPVECELVVPGERILPTLISDLKTETGQPLLIANQPYAARIRSDVPVTVQGIRHIFERGKYEFSRSWAVLDAFPALDRKE